MIQTQIQTEARQVIATLRGLKVSAHKQIAERRARFALRFAGTDFEAAEFALREARYHLQFAGAEG